jgi:hypothetical protein
MFGTRIVLTASIKQTGYQELVLKQPSNILIHGDILISPIFHVNHFLQKSQPFNVVS